MRCPAKQVGNTSQSQKLETTEDTEDAEDCENETTDLREDTTSRSDKSVVSV